MLPKNPWRSGPAELADAAGFRGWMQRAAAHVRTLPPEEARRKR